MGIRLMSEVVAAFGDVFDRVWWRLKPYQLLDCDWSGYGEAGGHVADVASGRRMPL